MQITAFKDVVGQDSAKRELGFHIQGYHGGGIMPNIALVAPKGLGKTYLAKKIGASLTYKNEQGKMVPKPFYEISCTTVESIEALFKDLFIKCADKHATFFFDEASEIKRRVSMALLTILNPNPQNMTSFSVEDYTVNFDFSKQTFIFATSEGDKVYKPLLDRLKRIELQDYKLEELGVIIQKNLKGIKVANGLLMDIASTVRGNARQAQVMSNDIKTALINKSGNKDEFNENDWEATKKALGINPLGISPLEMRLMQLLKERKNMTVTALSAAMGLTMNSVRRDVEYYLLRLGLIEAGEMSRRQLTHKGQKYLENLC